VVSGAFKRIHIFGPHGIECGGSLCALVGWSPPPVLQNQLARLIQRHFATGPFAAIAFWILCGINRVAIVAEYPPANTAIEECSGGSATKMGIFATRTAAWARYRASIEVELGAEREAQDSE
jgi:hypothetical protein